MLKQVAIVLKIAGVTRVPARSIKIMAVVTITKLLARCMIILVLDLARIVAAGGCRTKAHPPEDLTAIARRTEVCDLQGQDPPCIAVAWIYRSLLEQFRSMTSSYPLKCQLEGRQTCPALSIAHMQLFHRHTLHLALSHIIPPMHRILPLLIPSLFR